MIIVGNNQCRCFGTLEQHGYIFYAQPCTKTAIYIPVECDTYLPMYSPCSTMSHAWHLKHSTCHWRSRATSAWPSFSSSRHPAHWTHTRKIVTFTTYNIIKLIPEAAGEAATWAPKELRSGWPDSRGLYWQLHSVHTELSVPVETQCMKMRRKKKMRIWKRKYMSVDERWAAL